MSSDPIDGIENSVYDSVNRVVGVPYHRINHPRDIHDVYALRSADDVDIVLPTGGDVAEDQFHGARVLTPRAGISRNVTYIDLSSLYPNGFRALNVGPDTLVGLETDLDESPFTASQCVWSYVDPRPVKRIEDGDDWQQYTDGEYKMVRDPEAPETKWVSPREQMWDNAVRCYYLDPSVRRGFAAENFDDLIDIKYDYSGDVYEAVKAFVVNSGYGVYGDKHFRLFEWLIGESITLFGRKILTHSVEYVVDRVRTLVPEADVAAVIGDTDGAGISVEGVDRDTAMQAVQTACHELNSGGYADFCAETFGIEGDHYMEIEVESYAPRLFVPADDDHEDYPDTDVGTKKRYAKWETVDEGESVDDISITGMEAVRSDVAPITKTVQRDVLETVLRADGLLSAKDEVYPYLRDHYRSAVAGEYDIERVAKRGGIGQPLHEYGSQSRRPQPLYRGAKFAHEYVDGVHLGEGAKPMAVYVSRVHADGDVPATYRSATAEDGDEVDVIAVEDPTNLPSGIDIDWERHATKAIREPLSPILQTLGWSWRDCLTQTEQTGFTAFEGLTNGD